MCDYPLALTDSVSKSTDFTDWLLPDSRLPKDFVFIIKTMGPSGDVEQERIGAHKAMLAKSSKVFEDMIYNKAGVYIPLDKNRLAV